MKIEQFYQSKIKDIKGKIPLFRKRTLLRFASDYAKECLRLKEIDHAIEIKRSETRVDQLQKLYREKVKVDKKSIGGT